MTSTSPTEPREQAMWQTPDPTILDAYDPDVYYLFGSDEPPDRPSLTTWAVPWTTVAEWADLYIIEDLAWEGDPLSASTYEALTSPEQAIVLDYIRGMLIDNHHDGSDSYLIAGDFNDQEDSR